MALTAERNTRRMVGEPIPVLNSAPVKGATKIWKGSQVALDANGLAAPASSATNLVPYGRAKETYDNSAGADSAITCETEFGVFKWDNASAGDAVDETMVGRDVFMVDDHTVTKTATGRSRAGTCVGIDTDGGILVYVGPAQLAGSVIGVQHQTVTITQAADLAGLAGGVTSFDKDLGAALPANAHILGFSTSLTTGFDDATHATYTAKAGGAGSTDLFSALNVTTGQTGFPKQGTVGALGFPMAPQGSQQLVVNISSTVDLNTATAGSMTVDVFFVVIA